MTERREVSLSPVSLFCTDSEDIMRRADLESCHVLLPCNMWGFPKIRGTFLMVPIIRTIVYWGLYWGTPYFGDGKEEMPWKEGCGWELACRDTSECSAPFLSYSLRALGFEVVS